MVVAVCGSEKAARQTWSRGGEVYGAMLWQLWTDLWNRRSRYFSALIFPAFSFFSRSENQQHFSAQCPFVQWFNLMFLPAERLWL